VSWFRELGTHTHTHHHTITHYHTHSELRTDVGLCDRPVHGLIFLFKYNVDKPLPRPQPPAELDPSVYYATQVIENACGTQAILNVLMNVPHVDLGAELNNFREFTRDMTPDLRGLAMNNSEVIRSVHNSLARAECYTIEEDRRPKTADDVRATRHSSTTRTLTGSAEGVPFHRLCAAQWARLRNGRSCAVSCGSGQLYGFLGACGTQRHEAPCGEVRPHSVVMPFAQGSRSV
jgi:hypothetical protein